MDEELKSIKDNYYLIKKSYCKNYYINNKAKILNYQQQYNKKKKEKKHEIKINHTKQVVDF